MALDLGTWGISSAATLLRAEHRSSTQNAATTAASRSLQQAPKRRATAAAGRGWATRTNATHPGGGKEIGDHASARAGVRVAATPAREALAPCDILNSLPPGGDQELKAVEGLSDPDTMNGVSSESLATRHADDLEKWPLSFVFLQSRTKRTTARSR